MGLNAFLADGFVELPFHLDNAKVFYCIGNSSSLLRLRLIGSANDDSTVLMALPAQIMQNEASL